MELPTGELHQINSQITKANQAQFGKKPYFSLNVMQPTPAYKTLNQCVNYLFQGKKFPTGYGKMPDKDWHISTIVVAIPFKGQPNKAEVQKAMEKLARIIKKHKATLKGTTFTFKKLESIGKHKFIAAHYDFKNAKHKATFLKAYAQIINEFLNYYPDAWMMFGYRTIPHVSIASTGNPTQKVTISTQKCNPIKDVELMYGTRNLFISAGYYDQQAKKMDFLTSNPI